MVPGTNEMTGDSSTKNRARGIFSGAIGFGIGFAIAGALFGAVAFRINDFDTNEIVRALLFALAGLVGGTALGLALRARRRLILLFALAAAAGLGLGYWITSAVSLALFSGQTLTELVTTLVFVVQFGLVGALAGALVGAVQRESRQAAELALAGAFGFGIGFFLQDTVGSLINDPVTTLVPGTPGDPTHDSIVLALVFGSSFLLAGLVGGAALGLAINPRQTQG